MNTISLAEKITPITELDRQLGLLESWTPLLLGMHGIVLLLWSREPRLWVWLVVLGLVLIGLQRFLPWFLDVNMMKVRAGYIFCATWGLMLATGGVASFFLLWYFVFISVYTITFSRHSAISLLVGCLTLAYFSLWFLIPQTQLPLVVILSRILLLSFIGIVLSRLASVGRSFVSNQQAAIRSLNKEGRQLRTLIDAIPDYIYFKDTQSRFVINNKAHIDLVGATSQEQLVGKTDADVFATRDAEQFKADEQILLQTRQPLVDYHEWVQHRDGNQRLHLTTKVPLYDSHGQISGVVGITRDITEQHEISESLRKISNRNQALLSALPDAIVHLHRDGTVLDIKPPSSLVSPISAEQMRGGKTQEIAPPKLAQRMKYYINQAMETGVLQTFEHAERIEDEILTREARVMPTANDEVVAVIRDVTDRRLAKEALKRSEAFNQSVLDSLAAHIAVLDKEGTIVAVNKSWRQFGEKNGNSAPEAIGIGANYLSICQSAKGESARDTDSVSAEILAVIDGQEDEFNIEYPCHSPTTQRWFILNVVPLEGTAGGVVVSHTDITRTKEAQASLHESEERVQEQRSQLRMLNQRLTEIQENERKEIAQELHDQIGQNLSTVGLNLAMIQAQLNANQPQTIPLATLLDDSQYLLKQTTERVRTVLSDLRPPMLDDFGLPPTLEWYAEQVMVRGNFAVRVDAPKNFPRLSQQAEYGLFRITQEAMTNILKHADATQVALMLDEAEDRVCLTITDNGCGFDATDLATRKQVASWGVLTMRERAEAINGEFTIDSQVGMGTTIKVKVIR